ncbi:TcaA second domain-containing protein [Brevibacillus daliensis]|uniref:TcaA second domain-containing protein n=1 Tax=Brevibacillus daliensis TaxID=2892995 RepID=UPI001E39E265|nr:hypothetical protein [Brevibacillus daliensis]
MWFCPLCKHQQTEGKKCSFCGGTLIEITELQRKNQQDTNKKSSPGMFRTSVSSIPLVQESKPLHQQQALPEENQEAASIQKDETPTDHKIFIQGNKKLLNWLQHNKKKIWIAVSIGLLTTGGIASWQIANQSNPHRVVERYIEAIKSEDYDLLASVITSPRESHVTDITEENLRLLVEYVKGNLSWEEQQAELNEQVKLLMKNPEEFNMISMFSKEKELPLLVQKGKSWLFFDTYKVELPSEQVIVEADIPVQLLLEQSDTVTALASETRGRTGHTLYRYHTGPLYPGTYTLTANVESPIGPIETELPIKVTYGEREATPYWITSQFLLFESSNDDTKVFYQDKELTLEWKKIGDKFFAEVGGMPTLPLLLTTKSETDYGVLTQQLELDPSEIRVNVDASIGTFPKFQSEMKALFKGYNMNWLRFARDKKTADVLKPYVVEDSRLMKDYLNEITNKSDLFIGKMTELAIDFQTARLLSPTLLQIHVREKFQEEWQNQLTGEIRDGGGTIVYWTYELEKSGDIWKIRGFERTKKQDIVDNSFEIIPLP